MSHSITIQPTVLSLLSENLEGKRVLDVGIGHGQWGYILRTWKPGHPYIIGVEPYVPYIENAGRVGIYNELHTMTGQQYLAENLEAKFDAILLCEVLEHHRIKEEAWDLLEELEKRLNPGGILILSTPDGHSTGAANYDGNELNDHPIGFRAREFVDRGYQTKRILKEGFTLGHIVGPIAFVWWTLRWRRRPATHTVVAWRRC